MEYPQWCKAHPSWGRNYRLQRNVYAMRVTLSLTGGAHICPCCNSPFDIASDSAIQVDRVNPSLDYGTLGNIVYICEACNQGRAQLQRIGKDWRKVNEYALDVKRAAKRVSVPSIREAREEWERMREGRGGSASRYA